ncbi:hypothetical protein [Gallaecimonas xiamenensis]|uniref:hypothetical protein n=1 Tax=Gallaecimonas xiamenensis TaxID=1207039 RepID=UPI0012EA8026|nr:hypothetical protein [Gallaecimonas xiamenensis]
MIPEPIILSFPSEQSSMFDYLYQFCTGVFPLIISVFAIHISRKQVYLSQLPYKANLYPCLITAINIGTSNDKGRVSELTQLQIEAHKSSFFFNDESVRKYVDNVFIDVREKFNLDEIKSSDLYSQMSPDEKTKIYKDCVEIELRLLGYSGGVHDFLSEKMMRKFNFSFPFIKKPK